jgi:cytochrome c oxidase subunit 2
VGKGWSYLFGVVLAATFLIWLIAPAMGWWLPANVASFGDDVDYLFYVILGFTGFFFVLTEALMVYAMWKYAHRPGEKAAYVEGNHSLEIIWTIVPAGILLFIAFAQINAWERIKYATRMPHPEQVVQVTGRQWEWRLRYPAEPKRFRVDMRFTLDDELFKSLSNQVPAPVAQALKSLKGNAFPNRYDFGKELASILKKDEHKDSWAVIMKQVSTELEKKATPDEKKERDQKAADARRWAELPEFDDLHAVNELHTWKGANVKIFLKTADVLHSFGIPNLRLMQDALPGKTIPMWFSATDSNAQFKNGQTILIDPQHKEWEIACKELCGNGHYRMKGRLYVYETREEYEQWLAHQLRLQKSHEPERTSTPVARTD